MSELPRPDQSSTGRVPDSPPISVRHDVAPTRRDASSPAGSGQVVNFGEKPRAVPSAPFIVMASDSLQEVKQRGNDAASERGVAANDGAQAVVEEIGTLDRQVVDRSEAREGGNFSATEPGDTSFQRLANTPEGRDRQARSYMLPPGAVDADGNPIRLIPVKLTTGKWVLVNGNIYYRGAGESGAPREPADDRKSVSSIHDAGGDPTPDRDVASGSEVPNRSVQSNEVDNDVSKTSELHAEVREPITIHDRTDGGDVQPEVSDTGKRKTIDIATPDFDHGSQDEWERFFGERYDRFGGDPENAATLMTSFTSGKAYIELQLKDTDITIPKTSVVKDSRQDRFSHTASYGHSEDKSEDFILVTGTKVSSFSNTDIHEPRKHKTQEGEVSFFASNSDLMELIGAEEAHHAAFDKINPGYKDPYKVGEDESSNAVYHAQEKEWQALQYKIDYARMRDMPDHTIKHLENLRDAAAAVRQERGLPTHKVDLVTQGPFADSG